MQIRNLPDDLYLSLTFRAEHAQRSLAQQALVELLSASEQAEYGRRQQILNTIKSCLKVEWTQVSAAPEILLRTDRDH